MTDRIAGVRRGWGGGAVALGIIAIAVVANQSAVHWRSNRADSDLAAWHAWCVRQGARPYLDIWNNKPPGTVWVNAAAQSVVGPGVESELLVGTAAITLSLLAFVGIARTVYHPSVAVPAAMVGGVLLTNLHNECGANRHETFVVACETIALLGYFRWLRSGRAGWLILAGLVAGAAPIFKQAGLAVTAACATHLLWWQFHQSRARHDGPINRGAGQTARWSAWLIAGTAFSVAPLMATGVLAGQGALSAARFAVGEFNDAYFAIDDASWIRVDRAIGIYQPVLRELAGVLGVALLGVGAGLLGWWRGWWQYPSGKVPGAVPLLVLWFLLGFYIACVSPGRQGHHLMPVLPALALLVLYPVHLLAGQRGLIANLTLHPSAAVALVLWFVPLGQLAASSVGEMQRCWQVKLRWSALRRAAPTGAQQQGAYIRAHTAPDDRIYIWGWSPGAYRAAQRLPASRYATLEKVGQLGEHARFILDGAIADHQANPPRAFVVSHGDYERMRRQGDSRLRTWLREHYQHGAQVSGMHILLRRLPDAGG